MTPKPRDAYVEAATTEEGAALLKAGEAPATRGNSNASETRHSNLVDGIIGGYRDASAPLVRPEAWQPRHRRSEMHPEYTSDLLARFWLKVNKDGPISEQRPDLGPCWLWTGALLPKGYGTVAQGTPRRTLSAHRVSYEIHHGPIPEGLQIDHLCRVRRCVNPAHLEVVTARENLRRGQSPTMLAHLAGTCKRGHPFTPEYGRYQEWRGRIGWVCRVCRRIWEAENRTGQHG